MENSKKLGDYEKPVGQRQPDFNVKFEKQYVGNGWIEEGKYGKYIAITLTSPVPSGAKLYLSIRKGSTAKL